MSKLNAVFLTIEEIDALSRATGILLDEPEGVEIFREFSLSEKLKESLQSASDKLYAKAVEIDEG